MTVHTIDLNDYRIVQEAKPQIVGIIGYDIFDWAIATIQKPETVTPDLLIHARWIVDCAKDGSLTFPPIEFKKATTD